ncbi:MAG: hypothetical protein AAGA08_07000 [Pseudomonadota bacterium]
MSTKSISIDLVGILKVSDKDGADLTPLGKKDKGVIAILGASSDMRCSRSKLQDKLWSDRAYEQGSNSLRQALTSIRRQLGPYRDLLITNDDWVGFDPEQVQVNLSPQQDYPAHMLPEFAEGLHINDPEFEDWIREQRSYYERQWQNAETPPQSAVISAGGGADPAQRKEPTLLIIASLPSADHDLKTLTELTLRDAAKRASSFGDFAIVDETAGLQPSSSAMKISCLISRYGDRIVLQPLLMVANSFRTIWSQTFQCDLSQIIEVTDEISDALTLAILRSGGSVLQTEGLLEDLPLGAIFGYSREGLYGADDVLAQADAERDVPAYLSLRAYIRHTMIMERVTEHRDHALDEADEMVTRAMEKAPHDPFTLSVRSLISGLKDHEELAVEYAQRAVHADRRNAFARQALSVALSFSGYQREANEAALSARESRMIVISPAIYFLRCAYTALGVGNEKDALSYAKMAHGTAPEFRPALRVMAALCFRQGDEAGAVSCLTKLRELEPDFTLDLMADDSYPVDTLRNANALDIVKSKLI